MLDEIFSLLLQTVRDSFTSNNQGHTNIFLHPNYNLHPDIYWRLVYGGEIPFVDNFSDFYDKDLKIILRFHFFS